MAILIDQNTKLLCQGMTGWAGTYHTNRMIQYGTKVVAGVTPGKGGKSHLDVPVFDDVAEAMRTTAANASAIFVPPDRAAQAMLEAIEAEMPLVVVVTERIPVLDMIRVREALAGSRTRLLGPNSQGILAPDVCQIGVMATDRAKRGSIGVVSRSASLTSEITGQLTTAGLGQSTTLGIGGDPVHGLGFVDCLKLFFDDPQTEGVVLIGEIGGTRGAGGGAIPGRIRRREAGCCLRGRPLGAAGTSHGACRRAGAAWVGRRGTQDRGAWRGGRGDCTEPASCRHDDAGARGPARGLTSYL